MAKRGRKRVTATKRRFRRATTRAKTSARGARIGNIGIKNAVLGGVAYSVVRKVPIFNQVPAQYQQPARMIGLGVGAKALGVSGMQHFTATGVTLGVANFFETSNVLGGILGGARTTTRQAVNTV